MNAAVSPIVLSGVSQYFNGRAALDDLSIDFPLGKTTTVVGGSGSGKSLVLKCAAGLLFPDEGQVFFEGKSISGMREKDYQMMQARTGFHFQDAALWANKSLGENLSLPLLSTNPDFTDIDLKMRVAESFDSVGLNLDPSARPASISMGQRKLVSFLRATITGPEILFLDDPLAFMDRAGTRQLLARIRDFRDAGATIIIATHDKELIGGMADRIAVLSDGRMAASGNLQDVVSSIDSDLQTLLRELV